MQSFSYVFLAYAIAGCFFFGGAWHILYRDRKRRHLWDKIRQKEDP